MELPQGSPISAMYDPFLFRSQLQRKRCTAVFLLSRLLGNWNSEHGIHHIPIDLTPHIDQEFCAGLGKSNHSVIIGCYQTRPEGMKRWLSISRPM